MLYENTSPFVRENAATGSFLSGIPRPRLLTWERQKKVESENFKVTFEVQQFHTVYPSTKWEHMQKTKFTLVVNSLNSALHSQLLFG